MRTGARILVMEDDDFLRKVIREKLASEGHDVVTVGTVAACLEAAGAAAPDVALLDLMLPDGSGLDALRTLLSDTDAACIMMTAHGSVETAVEALKLGARDYLEKPLSFERLLSSVDSALELTALRREVRALREESGLEEPIVAESVAMEEVLDLVEKVAPAESTTVLVQGETGTGKGMVARLVHRLSPRSEGPFVNVTCSALAPTVMESELFGHEKGAFTDAHTMKRGLVEVAEGGTLFLDEIAELSSRLQGTLLRFIEEKAFRRVGGTEDLTVDARLVAATNRDLEREVEQGGFRADLYYRLSVVTVEIPPLRERPADVEALAKHFVATFAGEFGKEILKIDPAALELLQRSRWPGNVRELKNVVERGVLLAPGDTLTPDLLPAEIRSPGRRSDASGPELGPEGIDLESLEEELVRRALRRTEGNQTAAGELLGLSRHQVRRRVEKYGLDE
jgi:DNA-binding NtrC family response regulator